MEVPTPLSFSAQGTRLSSRLFMTELATLLPRTVLALALVLAAPAAWCQDSVQLRIIAINDFHGHLEPGDNAVQVPDPDDPARNVSLRSGGAAHLAAHIRQLRAEQPHSIVVSSGDLIGGSPLISGLFLDEPTIEVMNAIGLDLNAVGNHEFDRGAQELLRIVGGGCRTDAAGDSVSCASRSRNYTGARFPFIAANIDDREGRPLFMPAVIRRFDGVQVGFIGAVTRRTPSIVQPAGIAGLRFSGEAQAINTAAEQLRRQGVKAIVAVIHEGGDADGGFNDCANPRGAIFDIERQLDPDIDVVLSAHTHRGYRCVIKDRLVIQGASFGRLVSVVDLSIDRTSGEVMRDRTRARNLPVPNDLSGLARLQKAYPALPPDPEVAAIVEHYRERSAPLADRTVGRLSDVFDREPAPGGDHALGRLIADSHLAATREQGAVIAFTNPGGIRTDLIPHSEQGTVTYGDLYAVQPFGNALVTVTLTGTQLRNLLEQQWSARNAERPRILQPSRGFSYAWDPARPAGTRVIGDSMRLNGQSIAADGNYRVTFNSFLAGGGDGFRVLRDGRDAEGGPLDIEALVIYVRRASADQPLRPDRTARIERRD
jgi:5'-nucleotidase